MNQEWHKTFCGFCHTNCGMEVLVKDGRIEKVHGDPDFPGSRGHLCPKGLAAAAVVHSPQRLRYPLLRQNGRLDRISWPRALDIIAAELHEIREKSGPEKLLQLRGAPVTEEVRDGFVQFMAAYGSPHATGPSHLCSTPRRLGQELVLGGRTIPDFERTRCLVIWGANPPDSRSFCEALIPDRFFTTIGNLKKRGAYVIVIDPRRTELAAAADLWINISVGTDMALGLSMINVIINEDLYDREFVSNWTIGFDRLHEHVRHLTPEWAETITAVPAPTIRRLARQYATAKPAAILDGNGLDQHPNVVQTIRVVSMLSAITGNIDIPGGNVFAPKPKTASYPTVRPQAKHLASDVIPLFPRITAPYMIDALLTGKPYTPKALITHHANPLLINANYKRVRQALEKLKLIVVYDILPTATSELAHVILPAACDFERYGYGVWPGFEGGYVALQRPVVDPPGESRSVFDVEYELAKKLGIDHTYPWTTDTEWINYRLGPLNITVDDLLREHVISVEPGIRFKKFMAKGFKTPSGKIELYSQKLKDHNQDPIPVFQPFAEARQLTEQYPLVGTTRRPGNYVHTRFRDVPALRRSQPDPLLRIHPQDAEARNILDDELVTVSSPEGEISIKARVTDETGTGCVVIDFGWGNAWDGGPNVNILTSDYPRCSLCGATPNRRFRCEVIKSFPRTEG